MGWDEIGAMIIHWSPIEEKTTTIQYLWVNSRQQHAEWWRKDGEKSLHLTRAIGRLGRRWGGTVDGKSVRRGAMRTHFMHNSHAHTHTHARPRRPMHGARMRDKHQQYRVIHQRQAAVERTSLLEQVRIILISKRKGERGCKWVGEGGGHSQQHALHAAQFCED